MIKGIILTPTQMEKVRQKYTVKKVDLPDFFYGVSVYEVDEFDELPELLKEEGYHDLRWNYTSETSGKIGLSGTISESLPFAEERQLLPPPSFQG